MLSRRSWVQGTGRKVHYSFGGDVCLSFKQFCQGKNGWIKISWIYIEGIGYFEIAGRKRTHRRKELKSKYGKKFRKSWRSKGFNQYSNLVSRCRCRGWYQYLICNWLHWRDFSNYRVGLWILTHTWFWIFFCFSVFLLFI